MFSAFAPPQSRSGVEGAIASYLPNCHVDSDISKTLGQLLSCVIVLLRFFVQNTRAGLIFLLLVHFTRPFNGVLAIEPKASGAFHPSSGYT